MISLLDKITFNYKIICMAKYYFKPSEREENKQLIPAKNTIDFILNYSKALNIIDYKNMKFETLLN